LFAQPFISGAAFGPQKQLSEPRSYTFEPYTGPATIPDPDFNLRSLRGNAVLRWEWRPGSTLFLAWQQNRSDLVRTTGDFHLRRDGGALLTAPADNVFVLKVSYWLNL
jgi:hypothetical protein